MSYSIAKTNYYINAVSFGKNQTDRTNTNFGIYEESIETTSSLSLSDILVGPQVVFSEPSAVVVVSPQVSETRRPSSTPRQGPSSILDQATNPSADTRTPPSTPRQGPSSILDQTNIMNEEQQNRSISPDDISNVISSVQDNVSNAFTSLRPNRAREAVRQAAEAAERASTNNFGRGNRR
jgi:hypothetical protein